MFSECHESILDLVSLLYTYSAKCLFCIGKVIQYLIKSINRNVIIPQEWSLWFTVSLIYLVKSKLESSVESLKSVSKGLT